jgi:pyrroloquinoline quinone (PQQ) biosynthesis protein C
MNRVHGTGIEHPKPYFSAAEGRQRKAELDAYMDQKMAEWKATVPFASHLTDPEIHQAYYRRTLIEHVWRIRLSRVSQSKAIYKIAQVSPRAAQEYAHYQADEMLHDQLYIGDCEAAGVSMEEILATEPYLSTKLFEGWFYYALEHESPMAPVVSNYLVEYTQAKLQPSIVASLQETLGKEQVKGQSAHLHVDTEDDHSMEMWKILSQLIFSEEDFRQVFRYIDDVQEILAMFFREIYQDTVLAGSGAGSDAVAGAQPAAAGR